jgi:hypothetical protein
MNFKSWFNELFDIENGKPADGKWSEEPHEGMGDAAFFFNLQSDPSKCNGPCYHVVIGKNGSISFGHVDTGTGDRFTQNQSTGTSGQEMLNAVLWAVKDYVTKANPPALTWSAVGKSRFGAKNTMAREKIYNKLAARFLTQNYTQQDKYWVRNDMVGRWQPPEQPAPISTPQNADEFQFPQGMWVGNDDESIVGQVVGQDQRGVHLRLRNGQQTIARPDTLSFMSPQQALAPR